MVAAAAATSILSLCGSSPVHADSDASGATKGSPGVLSGNNVQVPVDAPVNACGNSVDVIALLNPAFGNSCANDSGSSKGGSYGEPYGGGDSGYGSGHTPPPYGGEDTPTPTPPNGGGHPTPTPPNGGGHPTPTPPNGGGHPTPTPTPTPTHTPPTGGEQPTPTPTQTPSTGGGQPSTSPTQTPPTGGGQPSSPGHQSPPPHLPDTGSSSEALLAASGASVALIAAGAVLYRRGRNASHR